MRLPAPCIVHAHLFLYGAYAVPTPCSARGTPPPPPYTHAHLPAPCFPAHGRPRRGTGQDGGAALCQVQLPRECEHQPSRCRVGHADSCAGCCCADPPGNRCCAGLQRKSCRAAPPGEGCCAAAAAAGVGAGWGRSRWRPQAHATSWVKGALPETICRPALAQHTAWAAGVFNLS